MNSMRVILSQHPNLAAHYQSYHLPCLVDYRYAYCPNLTIIDTPGFILKAKSGESDNTPEEIMAMVKAQASPPHRCGIAFRWRF